MHTTLFGERKLNCMDWAKDVVKKGFYKPFNYLIFDTGTDMGMFIINEKGEAIHNLGQAGLYAIYHGNDCLYVGYSDSDMRYRISRFKKELANKSRKDESHPGAFKARRAGYKINSLYKLKYLTKDEVYDPKFDHLMIKEKHIDEYIAPLLKSKFNKKVRK